MRTRTHLTSMLTLQRILDTSVLFPSWRKALAKVILYVKSVKTLVGTKEIFRSRIWARDSRVAVETIADHKLVLPDDQRRTVMMVNAICRRLFLEVEVVDIARENALKRIVLWRRYEIMTFPTLLANTGQRLQGQMTEEKVDSFLSQIAKQEKKKYL